MNSYAAPLAEVTTQTLEELCFFFAMPLLNDEQREAETDAAMGVRFRGPLTGRLVVRLAGGMLPRLASNMLGDVDGSAAMQRDALGEVANVVCGNLLPLIGGSADVYAIEAAMPAVAIDRSAQAPAAVVQLGLEDAGRADVFLFLDAAQTTS
jgi:CheY-specific phosphatase CheX